MLNSSETLYYLIRPDKALNIWWTHKETFREMWEKGEYFKKKEDDEVISFGDLMMYFAIGVVGLALIIIGVVYCLNAWSYGYISNGLFAFCMCCFLLGGVGGVISVIVVFIAKRRNKAWIYDQKWKKEYKQSLKTPQKGIEMVDLKSKHICDTNLKDLPNDIDIQNLKEMLKQCH